MDTMLSALTANKVILALTVVLIGLLLHFTWQYLIRGIWLRGKLKALSNGIKALQGKPREELRDRLTRLFKGTPLEHAWGEYADTLHEQYDRREGKSTLRDIRATVSADAFFNLETTVDPRIGAEYFKHLPGLFTGLGIVGTFAGLITGLVDFKPDVETEQLRSTLSDLFTHVRSAFFFSAGAIGLAMLVTFVEKWLYSSCSKWLGEVTIGLDKLFRSGVGEEYLSGLLKYSEENATQTRQLKESLVEDLKVLLTNLTDRQVEATNRLSADLGQQITSSLKDPLDSIAETVRRASGEQTTAVSGVLENLMSAFLAQMRESVGGQMEQLGGLMQQTAQSLNHVEGSMRALVQDMQRASDESTTGMRSTVQQLIASMKEHQEQQSTAIGESASGLISRFERAMEGLASQHESMSQRTEETVHRVVDAMGARVDALTDANQKSTSAVERAVTALGSASTEAVDRMTAGASSVATAVESVHRATDRLGQLADQMAGMHTTILDSAENLTRSSGELVDASHSLQSVTTAMGSTATRLEAVGQAASSEADVRAGLLGDLKSMAGEARRVGQELQSLTTEVQEHLSSNVETFGTSVAKVLSQHLATYEKELADAVGMLRSALEELAEVAIDAKGP